MEFGSLVEWLSKPLVGSILGFIGVLSLPLAVYLYRLGKRRTTLSYQVVREFGITGGAKAAFPPELEMRFAGATVGQVTLTEIVVWNSGNTTVDASQIVSSDPLMLTVKEGDILRASILRSTRPVIGAVAQANQHSSSINLDFAFLDPNDGFVVQLIHSGDRQAVDWQGTIKGAPDGAKRVADFGRRAVDYSNFRTRPNALEKEILIIALLVGVAMMLAVVIPSSNKFILELMQDCNRSEFVTKVMLFILASTYVFVPLIVLWAIRRRYPLALVEQQEAGVDGLPSQLLKRYFTLLMR